MQKLSFITDTFTGGQIVAAPGAPVWPRT